MAPVSRQAIKERNDNAAKELHSKQQRLQWKCISDYPQAVLGVEQVTGLVMYHTSCTCEYLHTWIFLAGLLSKRVMPALQAVLRPVAQPQGSRHVLFEHFWVEAGEQPLPEPSDRPNFVMTTSVKGHLRNLARAALVRRFPTLLQASSPSSVSP